jgi:hypothetical protein
MFSFLCTTSSHKQSIVRRILTIHLLIASRSCKRPSKGVQGDQDSRLPGDNSKWGK